MTQLGSLLLLAGVAPSTREPLLALYLSSPEPLPLPLLEGLMAEAAQALKVCVHAWACAVWSHNACVCMCARAHVSW